MTEAEQIKLQLREIAMLRIELKRAQADIWSMAKALSFVQTIAECTHRDSPGRERPYTALSLIHGRCLAVARQIAGLE